MMRCVALLLLAVAVPPALAQPEQPYVYNTVTAVATRPEFGERGPGDSLSLTLVGRLLELEGLTAHPSPFPPPHPPTTTVATTIKIVRVTGNTPHEGSLGHRRLCSRPLA